MRRRVEAAAVVESKTHLITVVQMDCRTVSPLNKSTPDKRLITIS